MESSCRGIITQFSTKNNMAPLHVKLPPEVLMNIFRYLCPASCRDIQFTHVCSLWRELIFRTPEFWVDMLSFKSMFYRLDYDARSHLSLQYFIQRTSPLPFPLTLYWGLDLKLIDTVAPHVHRIASLTLFVLDKDRLMSHLFQRLPGSSFSSLRTLKIGDPRIYTVPLLNLLSQCPQLQELHLDLREDTRNPNPALFVDRPSVVLPCLRRCNIQDLRYSSENQMHLWAPPFLSKLQYPATTQLRIYSAYGRHIRPCSFIPFSPSVATIPAIEKLNLCFSPMGRSRPGDWSLLMEGRAGGSKVLTIDIVGAQWGPTHPPSGPSDVLCDLARLFEHAPSISLAVLDLEFGSGLSVVRSDWLLVLQAVPTLTVLSMRIGSCKSLFSVLRNNVSLCPSLRTLSIACGNGSGVHGELVSIVELRAREGQGLESLTFRGNKDTPLSTHRLARLKALVPHVDAL